MTPLSLATIKDILDAFARSGAEELEVADGTLRLRVLRRRVEDPLTALPDGGRRAPVRVPSSHRRRSQNRRDRR